MYFQKENIFNYDCTMTTVADAKKNAVANICKSSFSGGCCPICG